MQFGITLTHTHTSIWREVATRADEAGLDSVWLPDHLVFPERLDTSSYPEDEAPPITPSTPLFDSPGYLCHLAALTTRIRLGTYVYIYGLRHPIAAARAFATTDILSNGRLELGVGAGWLRGEWDAVNAPFSSRGSRLDEAIKVTRRLWTEPVVEHDGTHWSWEPVCFEPKPTQPGGPPILVGGESDAALRRAATLGDGWLSMPHTLESVKPRLERLNELREHAGRTQLPFSVTVCAKSVPPPELVERWSDAGIDRLIVRPWDRARDTIPALAEFAVRYADHLHD